MRPAEQLEDPRPCVVRLSRGERPSPALAAFLLPVDPATFHEYRLPADSEVELHHHDFDEYWLFTSGTPRVTPQLPGGRREDYDLDPGDLVACVRGVSHTLAADHELRYHQFRSVPVPGERPGHLTD